MELGAKEPFYSFTNESTPFLYKSPKESFRSIMNEAKTLRMCSSFCSIFE